MKIRTVSRTIVALSILLFCVAVASYEFYEFKDRADSKNFDILSLVPDSCLVLLESDNFSYFITEYTELPYRKDLSQIRSAALFSEIIDGFASAGDDRYIHGLSNMVDKFVVASYENGGEIDDVLFFQVGPGGESYIHNVIVNRMTGGVEPSAISYRGEEILVYPLSDGRFMAVYSNRHFMAMSFRVACLESVVDILRDSCGAVNFRSRISVAGTYNYFTIYSSRPMAPFMHAGVNFSSEYELHFKPGAMYIVGETIATCGDECEDALMRSLSTVPNIYETSLVMSSSRDSIRSYVADKSAGSGSMLETCVSTLSPDADYIFVVDMQKVVAEPSSFDKFIPPFLINNAGALRNFVASVQLSIVGERVRQIIVLSYKKLL